MPNYTFFADNLDQLQQLPAQILAAAEPRRKFILHGQMGAGKTTLVSAICRFLGAVDTPASPTYALVHKYKTHSQSFIYHVDLYRLDRLDDNMYAELEEMLYDDSYCFIEWADILLNFLPPNHVVIKVAQLPDERRQIDLHFV